MGQTAVWYQTLSEIVHHFCSSPVQDYKVDNLVKGSRQHCVLDFTRENFFCILTALISVNFYCVVLVNYNSN